VATLDDAHRELRLELLVELAFIATYSDLGSHDEALRMIALEAARVTGRTPGEQLVMLAAQTLGGETSSDPAGLARNGLALRLHREYPDGFAAQHVPQTRSARARRTRHRPNIQPMSDGPVTGALRAGGSALARVPPPSGWPERG
jgi:hypothetical protein